MLAVDWAVDGIAGVVVSVIGYAVGRIDAARRHGTWPHHVTVDVHVDDDERDTP